MSLRELQFSPLNNGQGFLLATSESIFHLAIPCADLGEAKLFYVETLGCECARTYDDRITVNFFGHQLVCHLSPNHVDPEPAMYPRHFGITFDNAEDFEAILNRARQTSAAFFREPFVRFEGQREEHRTFFLRDPSNNLIEFKYYRDSEMKY